MNWHIIMCLLEGEYSFIKIFPIWKDEERITPSIKIPYLSWNKRLLMSEFIEPFWVALSQFLTEEERGKLPPPWSEREEEEKKKGKRKRRKDEQSDDGRISVRFVGEIDPRVNFYNYYDVIFEYKNERLTWKAISCKKDEEEITNNKLYNPMESQEIVNDIDNILKLTIPQKYLQVLNGKNYESFEKRLDYITVSSKEEFSELKRAEKNDNFKTTDECLDFMIEEVKKAFGSDAENFKIIDNYDYHGWHINFTFEAYKSFTVKIHHELADGAQIVIGSDEQIRNGNYEHWFNIPMSANDFGRLTAKEFLAQLKQNLELRL